MMSITPQLLECFQADRLPILIAGPTASGKSSLALELAERLGGVVVNADALQVYSCWRLLTARPSAEEELRVPHLLYGHVDRDTAYSVGHWLREVEKILPGERRPIITGGTCLYFTSLISGLADIPHVKSEVREAGDRLDLQSMVSELDEETRGRIDLENRARVQRAWEVLRSTGRGLASWQAETGPPLLTQAHRLVLGADKDWLAARIDRRFDDMMARGALDEVRRELPHRNPAIPSGRAIGVSELASYLRGERPLDEAVEAAKLATRQYARRQRKWFRTKMRDWHWIDPAA